MHIHSFDTSMAQKSAFKMQQQGVYVPRKSFPQLPGAIVENPTYIETKHGNKLLTSGWWAYARKPVRDVHGKLWREGFLTHRYLL